jgi:hypothetical protein
MLNREVAKEIMNQAQNYHNNLENKNLLFVFQKRGENDIEMFEVLCLPKNFLHLTGVDINRENVSGAVDFYNLALNGKLKESHFTQGNKGIIEKKLFAMKQTMFIHNKGREIGEFSGNYGSTYTEKLAGSTKAAMGFTLDDEFYTPTYVPNTNLEEAVRNLIKKPYGLILATLSKDMNEKEYKEITHIKKGLDLSELKLPPEILSKLTDEAKTQLNQKIIPLEKEAAPPPIAPALTAGDFIVERHIGQTFTVSGGDEPDKRTPALEKVHNIEVEEELNV